MNAKKLLIICLAALFSLSGCALFQKAPVDDNSSQTDAMQICPGGVCETDPFVNYTQTRADYEQYGELSERDVIVSEAGAGNNLSAAIPPSLENEMIEYEEQVENEAQMAEAEATDSVVLPETDASDRQALPEEKTITDNPNPEQQKDFTVAQNDVQNNETTNSTKVLNEDNEDKVEQKSLENSDLTDNVTSEETIVSTDQNESQTETKPAGENENNDEDEDEEDPVRDWYAEEGQNLKALLTDWSAQSGWRLVWNSNRNYVLNAGAMFRGRFADVSSALIRAFARARPAPVATFYKGNRVLVVETMEDENAYD